MMNVLLQVTLFMMTSSLAPAPQSVTRRRSVSCLFRPAIHAAGVLALLQLCQPPPASLPAIALAQLHAKQGNYYPIYFNTKRPFGKGLFAVICPRRRIFSFTPSRPPLSNFVEIFLSKNSNIWLVFISILCYSYLADSVCVRRISHARTNALPSSKAPSTLSAMASLLFL